MFEKLSEKGEEYGLIKLENKETHIKRASEILTNAFENDPLVMYFFPLSDKKRLDKLSLLMTFFIKYCLRYGIIFIHNEYKGVITLLSGKDSNFTLLRELRVGGFKIIRKLGIDLLKKQKPYDLISIEMKNKAMNMKNELEFTPFLSIINLGVYSNYQQKGYGMELCAPIIQFCKEEKINIYLETHNKNNILFYEKVGFEVIDEMDIPNTTVTQWGLLFDHLNS
ncbi:MAG: GNAT family N-acetyltransferase [Promethearchaeota archaeon]